MTNNSPKPIDILAAMTLFGSTFRKRLLRDSWKAWRSFLAALFALPMDTQAREIYQRHTGRTDTPAQRFRESFVIVGRRGGKSLIAALVAVYLACFKDYRAILAPGETGVVMILAADRRQARVILGYIDAFLSIPLLASMVVARLKESITLDNRVQIEIHTSNYRSVRGFTLVAAICDEISFWPQDESASPDTEVLNALRPALATTNGLLLAISSPYSKRGELWTNYREHYGKPSDVLVWKASSREMNPTLSPVVVQAALLRDRAAASSEYLAEFRDDIETFISIEVVEACIVAKRFELPFSSSHAFVAFVDPSGGRADSMTLAIAHMEGDKAVLDLLREIQAPFSPEGAAQEFADTLKSYHLSEIVSDAYGGDWVVDAFRKHGILVRASERTRSELYLELLPMLMSGRCELLDNHRLVTQLVSLVRRVGRSGKDSVDHSPGSHDDIANCAAGALVLVAGPQLSYGWIEYVKGVASGHYKMPPAPQPEVQRLANGETRVEGGSRWNQPAPPPCPSCKSMCAWVGGGGARCTQCGHQFFPGGKPVVNYGDSRASYAVRNRFNAWRK